MKNNKKFLWIALFIFLFISIFEMKFIYERHNEIESLKQEIKITRSTLEALAKNSAEAKKDNYEHNSQKNDIQQSEFNCESLKRQLDAIQNNLIEPLSENAEKIKFWNTYKNDEYKFTIDYPNTFLLREYNNEQKNGLIVEFLLFNKDAWSLWNEPNPSFFTYANISYWDDINEPYAKGGEWGNDHKYKNLDDLFSDSESLIKKNKEISINGKKAYDVTISGHDAVHAIMIEHNNGIYRIEIPANGNALQMISSFVFTE